MRYVIYEYGLNLNVTFLIHLTMLLLFIILLKVIPKFVKVEKEIWKLIRTVGILGCGLMIFTLGIQIVSFAIEYSYLENIYQKEEYQIVEGVVENYAIISGSKKIYLEISGVEFHITGTEKSGYNGSSGDIKNAITEGKYLKVGYTPYQGENRILLINVYE